MSKHLTEKIVALVDKEVDFSKETTTKELSFTNYQSAKICLAVAEDNSEITAKTNVKINAILDDESRVEIRNEEVELKTKNITEINFVSDELSHYEATKIEIVIEAISDTTLKGNIFAILGHARYEIQDDELVSGEATNETVETTESNTQNQGSNNYNIEPEPTQPPYGGDN